MAETVTDVLVAGSQLGRKGLVRGGGVGLAVGLFAPLVRPMTIRLSPTRYVGETM